MYKFDKIKTGLGQTTGPSKSVNLPAVPALNRPEPAIPNGVEVQDAPTQVSITVGQKGPKAPATPQIAGASQVIRPPHQPNFGRINEILGRPAPKLTPAVSRKLDKTKE